MSEESRDRMKKAVEGFLEEIRQQNQQERLKELDMDLQAFNEGIQKTSTISIKPTFRGNLSMILMTLKSSPSIIDNAEAWDIIVSELKNMATVADLYVDERESKVDNG